MSLPAARLRGVAVEIDLAPPVSLDPASQKDFQRAVEDRAIELNYVQRATEWLEFGRRHPNSREHLGVRLGPQLLNIAMMFPRTELHPVVKEADEIVRAALETLTPGILAGIRVRVMKQASAPEGDARLYLGDRVLQLSPERKGALGRPIHTVGVKLYMPPVELREDNGTVAERIEEGVEVRIESLNEDVSDLFVECEHHFMQPIERSGFQSLQPFVQQTSDFIDHEVASFLELSDAAEEASDG